MANRRNLKKIINYICNDLFSECIAASLYIGNGKKRDDVNALLTSIIVLRNDYICRISHPEPGIKPKDYFNSLKTKFNVQIGEIIDNIANF